MSIGNIVCSNCGKEYVWQQQLAGHTVRCTCGHVMPVPTAAPQVDSVYALAPNEDSKPAARSARPVNLDDSQFRLPCPACSLPIEFGGVVCTGCGYNVKTGEHVPIKAVSAASLSTAEQSMATATVLDVPQFVVAAAPMRQVEGETRRDLVLRYLGIIAVLLVLITVVLAVKSIQSARVPGTENLTAEDALIAEKLQSPGSAEARQWLEKDPQRMLGGYNARQAESKIDEMYRNGAVKVSCLAGRYALSVVVELPTEAEKRRRFFDWQQQHHGTIGESAITDSGQKYLQITMQR